MLPRAPPATNAGIHEMEKEGAFRRDLLARLAGLTLTLPPLSERREDIILLTRHFMHEFGLSHAELEPAVVEALVITRWERNVREIRSLVQYWSEFLGARIGGEAAGCISLDDLSDELAEPIRHRKKAAVPPPIQIQSRPSKEELERMLQRYEGSIKKVADHYHKDRKQVYRWMEHHGIEQ